jgi:hypothetical protein
MVDIYPLRKCIIMYGKFISQYCLLTNLEEDLEFTMYIPELFSQLSAKNIYKILYLISNYHL